MKGQGERSVTDDLGMIPSYGTEIVESIEVVFVRIAQDNQQNSPLSDSI